MRTKFSRILMLIALLLANINVCAYDFKINGIYYNIVSSVDQTVEVTYKDSNYDSYLGTVNIPKEVNYDNTIYTVVSIGDRAFCKCSMLTDIKIPETIKTIGISAFENCNHLLTVNIENLSAWCNIIIANDNYMYSPLYYGAELLLNDSQVTDLSSLTQDCTVISTASFLNQTSLKVVTIPDWVVSIGKSCFNGCTNMEELIIGSDCTELKESAFMGCTTLKKIIIKDSNTPLSLGRYKKNITNSYFYDSPLQLVYIGRVIKWENDGVNYSYYYPFKTVTTAIINADVSYSMFSTKLKNIYIGNNVTTINSPSSVENMYCFSSNITSISVGENTNIYVENKNNLSTVFQAITANYYNLIEFSNLENNGIFEYGSNSIPFLNPSFTNNVENMSARVDSESLNLNAGFYDSGLPILFSNDIWQVEINVPFQYTITKAPLTIMVNDASRVYGEENPEFTCSYFGFKNDDTEDALLVKPSIATTATVSSAVGAYPIIATNAEAKNYEFTYERGTLTIMQASQQIEWNFLINEAVVGDQIELNAVSTSGLGVEYSVNDESIAEIYTSGGKTYLDCMKEGVVVIKAKQSGNENYLSADRVVRTLTIRSITTSIESVKT